MGPNLKVATFNLWHGLAERGNIRFREFETQARRSERFRLALRELSELEPDILFLQELNPVSVQGRELAVALDGEFRGRVDQSGIKFFEHGFPLNLATGLGILVRGKARFEDEPSAASTTKRRLPSFVRLSGGLGFSGEKMSFHLSEQRYAQFQSIRHEAFGRLLVANVHLHHGFERFPEFMALLDDAVVLGKVSSEERERLLPYLDHARDRRLHEIDRLLEVIHEHEHDYDGVILGGDLNSAASGAAYRVLIADGFSDVALTKVSLENEGEGPTWDPISNFENHRLQRDLGFQFPLPNFGNPELTAVYQAFDQKPRRIDFLFIKGPFVREKTARLSKVERFGVPENQATPNALAPSDHFGVMATFGPLK